MTLGTHYSPPSAFGRFRLLHQIGAGVLGPVFRTHDPETERLVAVKAFTLDVPPQQTDRLAEELRQLVALEIASSRLATLLDAGVEDGVVYLAQEYVAGESLDAAVRQYGPAPMPDTARLVTHVADALDAGARLGVFHGALHPRDILVTPGETHLTGLGVATAVERAGGRAPVRRPYAAPEREAGGTWGAAADVFSLAAVTHEVLTGKRALPGTDEPLPGLGDLKLADSAPLRELLESALGPDPERRPASASEFASALVVALGLGGAGGLKVKRRSRTKLVPRLPGLDEPTVPEPDPETGPAADGIDVVPAGTGAPDADRTRAADEPAGVVLPPVRLRARPARKIPTDLTPLAASPDVPSASPVDTKIRDAGYVAERASDAAAEVVSGALQANPSSPLALAAAVTVIEPVPAVDVAPVVEAAAAVEAVVTSEAAPVLEPVPDTESRPASASDAVLADPVAVPTVSPEPVHRSAPEPATIVDLALHPGVGASIPSDTPALEPPESAVLPMPPRSAHDTEPLFRRPAAPVRAGDDSMSARLQALTDAIDRMAPVALPPGAPSVDESAVSRGSEAAALDEDHLPLHPAAPAGPSARVSAPLDFGEAPPPRVVRHDTALSRRGPSAAMHETERPAHQPEPTVDDFRDPGMLSAEPPVPKALDPVTSLRASITSRRVEPYRPLPPSPPSRRIPVLAGVAIGLLIGAGLGYWFGSRSAAPAMQTARVPAGPVAPAPSPAVTGRAVPTPSSAAPAAPAAGATAAPTPASGTPVGSVPSPTLARPASPTAAVAGKAAPAPAPAAPAAATVPKPAGKAGTVRVTSRPDRADVYVDGVRRGVTPRNVTGLTAGSHTIRVTRPGYQSQERTLDLTAGRPARVAFTLKRGKDKAAPAAAPTPVSKPAAPPAATPATAKPAQAPVSATKPPAAPASAPTSSAPVAAAKPVVAGPTGSLDIETRPPGARVIIDGRDLGAAPFVVGDLSEGKHDVRLELPGYKTWAASVTITGGARTRIAASLERSTTR